MYKAKQSPNSKTSFPVSHNLTKLRNQKLEFSRWNSTSVYLIYTSHPNAIKFVAFWLHDSLLNTILLYSLLVYIYALVRIWLLRTFEIKCVKSVSARTWDFIAAYQTYPRLFLTGTSGKPHKYPNLWSSLPLQNASHISEKTWLSF